MGAIKFDLSDIVNILIALLVFELLKKLFLDEALDKMLPSKDEYEVETYEKIDSSVDDNLVIERFNFSACNFAS